MPQRYTEKKRIKINTECHENPVYLNWMGTGGERNYWLFHKLQTRNLNTSIVGVFTPFIIDNTTAEGYTIETSRNAIETLVCGAYVDIEDIEGIKTMLYSPNVLMLFNPLTWQTEGVKWINVKPLPGSFKLYDTDEIKAEIQFTLELVDINIQSM
jgi:hypothetical protein